MSSSPQAAVPPDNKPGYPVVVLVILAVFGFIVLEAVLGLTTGYAGLLFFWYWGTAGKAELGTMLPTLIGALGGTATAWLLQYFAESHNNTGLIIVLLFIVVAIAIQVLDRLPILFNPPFMLFLTVLAAPLLQMHENFGRIVASILLAVLYFGGIVLVVTRLQRRADAAN